MSQELDKTVFYRSEFLRPFSSGRSAVSALFLDIQAPLMTDHLVQVCPSKHSRTGDDGKHLGMWSSRPSVAYLSCSSLCSL